MKLTRKFIERNKGSVTTVLCSSSYTGFSSLHVQHILCTYRYKTYGKRGRKRVQEGKISKDEINNVEKTDVSSGS